MIKFKNVSKVYRLSNVKINSLKNIFSFRKCRAYNGRKHYSLKGINFELEAGDCLGILGKNGAGKSTLLKLISKITLPTEGEVELGGRVSSLLEVGAGFHPDLTGYDNIFLSGAILGMSPREVKSKLNDIIEFAEIGKFIYQPVKTYSMGMYLRLAFSIGISLDSEIIVIDEALAVGDYIFQQKCLVKLKELILNGRTIIFVSHDINHVRNICNKTLLLKEGEAVYFGAVEGAEEMYHNI